MAYSIREGLTFDDLLLITQYSDVISRADIDITVKIKNVEYKHPIIPANMQSITGEKMVEAVIESGGLAIVHRFMDIEDQLNIAQSLSEEELNHVGFSIGVGYQHKENVAEFIEFDVNIFCIDIAHGDSKHGIEMTEWIRSKYPKVTIIAGNVATGLGAKRLWEAGADVVKCGIGAGSLCTTRIETGCGVPQMTALIDVSQARDEFIACNPDRQDIKIISDGGAKNAGDLVKSLCFSDMVMSGNLFSGCVECPGTILSMMGKTYKEYKGSSTHKATHIEGVAAVVPTKGKFKNIIKKLSEGIRSGCSYQNAHNLAELRDHPEFVRITNAGLIESHPHNIII